MEEFIAQDIGILHERMLIGQQVHTDYGKYIDLLAIDETGGFVVIELKKNMTLKDVVAPAIDYAAGVEQLPSERIADWPGVCVVTRYAAQNHTCGGILVARTTGPAASQGSPNAIPYGTTLSSLGRQPYRRGFREFEERAYWTQQDWVDTKATGE